MRRKLHQALQWLRRSIGRSEHGSKIEHCRVEQAPGPQQPRRNVMLYRHGWVAARNLVEQSHHDAIAAQCRDVSDTGNRHKLNNGGLYQGGSQRDEVGHGSLPSFVLESKSHHTTSALVESGAVRRCVSGPTYPQRVARDPVVICSSPFVLLTQAALSPLPSPLGAVDRERGRASVLNATPSARPSFLMPHEARS